MAGPWAADSQAVREARLAAAKCGFSLSLLSFIMPRLLPVVAAMLDELIVLEFVVVEGPVVVLLLAAVRLQDFWDL